MTSLGNLSEVDLSCLFTPTFSAVSVSIASVTCATTIFGNILILTSIYKYPARFKGSLYLFIGNLAAADLLLGLWLFLFILEEIFPDLQQIWFFCVAKPVGILVSYGCSSLSLLGISVDRFMAVMFPLKHLIKTQKRRLFIVSFAMMWTVSIIFGCLPVVLPNLKPPEISFVCRIGVIIPQSYGLVLTIVLLLSLVLNFILYGVVLWTIKYNRKPGNFTGSRKYTKTVLMFIIFVFFVACWIPFIICSFPLQTNLPVSVYENVICVRDYLARLGYINSSMNWIIYGVANKKIRTTFKQILWYRCCGTISNLPSFTSSSESRRVNNSHSQLRQTNSSNGHNPRTDVQKHSSQYGADSNEAIAEVDIPAKELVNIKETNTGDET